MAMLNNLSLLYVVLLYVTRKQFVTCINVCRYKQLLQRKGDLEELEKNLKEQQEKMALENQTHQATADQCKLLKEENDRSVFLSQANVLTTC